MNGQLQMHPDVEAAKRRLQSIKITVSLFIIISILMFFGLIYLAMVAGPGYAICGLIFTMLFTLLIAQFWQKRVGVPPSLKAISDIREEPTFDNLLLLMDTGQLIGDDKSNNVAHAMISILNNIPPKEWRNCPNKISRRLIQVSQRNIEFGLLKEPKGILKAAVPNSPKNKIIMDYHVSCIRAVSEMNCIEALTTVRKLAGIPGKTAASEMIRSAAAERIPSMEQRFAELTTQQILLRPSASPANHQELLIPAGIQESDSQQLLRPVASGEEF